MSLWNGRLFEGHKRRFPNNHQIVIVNPTVESIGKSWLWRLCHTLFFSLSQFISLVSSLSVRGRKGVRALVCTRLWDICGFRFSLPPTGCCWRHARIPFDKGRRSSGPIIQTSRRGREDRRDGVSKATCSLSARSLALRPLAGQSGAQRSERESKEEHGGEGERWRHDAIYSYPVAHST